MLHEVGLSSDGVMCASGRVLEVRELVLQLAVEVVFQPGLVQAVSWVT